MFLRVIQNLWQLARKENSERSLLEYEALKIGGEVSHNKFQSFNACSSRVARVVGIKMIKVIEGYLHVPYLISAPLPQWR